MEKITQAIANVCKELFNVESDAELTRPDEQFGDYATNVALKIATQLNKNPRETAEQIAAKLKGLDEIKEVSVAGPGFINISLADQELWRLAEAKPEQTLAGKTVIIEYSDPNPFKELHVGHLYDSLLGESIAILNETAGAKVYRLNFGGDVGRHVAQTMWAALKKLDNKPGNLDKVPKAERASWISACYVEGAATFEQNEQAKHEITELNQKIYEIHNKDDHQSDLAKIYWECRQWSYDYFNDFYKKIGTKFDKYYPESQTAEIGLKAVKEQLEKGVFKKSDGAVVYDGEVHSLHTRVFINSKGLPTYETKDIGLALAKKRDFKFYKNIILTGSDIIEYMKVVLAALKQFEPEVADKTLHLTHGMVKLQGGAKMSSRKGNIVRAVDVIDMVSEAAKKAKLDANDDTVMAAVKYDFLKQRYQADIVFDVHEAVSLQGNSGPYLQYAHARARSILAKKDGSEKPTTDLDNQERRLLVKISEFKEVVDRAIEDLMPHHVAIYLYELAQTFNRFYENSRVIDDPREAMRLKLVQHYADTLKEGLSLLNVAAPDKM